MEENQVRRPRRTLEERIADIDAKIAARCNDISALQEQKAAAVATFDEKIKKAKEKIDALEAQKKHLTAPKPKKQRKTEKQLWEELRVRAKKAGFKPNDVAELLELNKDDATPAGDSVEADGE